MRRADQARLRQRVPGASEALNRFAADANTHLASVELEQRRENAQHGTDLAREDFTTTASYRSRMEEHLLVGLAIDGLVLFLTEHKQHVNQHHQDTAELQLHFYKIQVNRT